jgi:23S rRNA (pseudouridine1915-N3)-methyltransferase
MQLLVVAIGRRMPSWVQQGWSEYARRFPRGWSLDIREVPVAKRHKNAAGDSVRAIEGRALLAAVPEMHRVIALDERGEPWSTGELAERLQAWMREERGVSFLIGGPDGLGGDCLARAQDRWSLGRLTLPHPMVRVLVAEQLYRAWTIAQNHPYHRN